MSYTKDPRVDAYIDALPAWQQDICHQVRDIAHEADPEMVKTIKREALLAYIRQIAANNRAGGWRKLKAT